MLLVELAKRSGKSGDKGDSPVCEGFIKRFE